MSGISITKSVVFCLLLACLFLFTLDLVVFFNQSIYLSGSIKLDHVLFKKIHFANLLLLTGVLRPFTLNVITDKVEFT